MAGYLVELLAALLVAPKVVLMADLKVVTTVVSLVVVMADQKGDQ